MLAGDAGVRIRLLGGFEVTVGDRPVAAYAWRLRKAKTLVKLLALAGGHRLHREALVAVLWPDRDGASAANNLHQALYVARRVVGGASGGLFCLRDDIVLLSDGAMPWLDTEAFDAAASGPCGPETPRITGWRPSCTAVTCCPRTALRTGPKGHAKPCVNSVSACSWSTPRGTWAPPAPAPRVAGPAAPAGRSSAT